MVFYVYTLRVDGHVFYVGKGSRQRMFWHRHVLTRPATKEYQRPVYRRMRTVLRGREFTEEKVFETQDETEALTHEQTLIQHYGFDTLVNTQSHAFVGRRLKPEACRLISERLLGQRHPVARVEKRLHSWKVNPANIKQARQQALINLAIIRSRPVSAATRSKLSALRKGKPMPLGHGARTSAGLVGKASRRNALSSFRGVTWFAPKHAWQCRIQSEGKTRLLGQFKLELDAAWTYDNEFERLRGNRPNGTPLQHQVTRFRLGMHGKLIKV